MEFRQPYTQNINSFPSSKEKTLTKLRQKHYAVFPTPAEQEVEISSTPATANRFESISVDGQQRPKILFSNFQTPRKPQANGTDAAETSISQLGGSPLVNGFGNSNFSAPRSIADGDLLSNLNGRGYPVKSMDDLDRLRPRGSFDDALDVVATVLTYIFRHCIRPHDRLHPHDRSASIPYWF